MNTITIHGGGGNPYHGWVLRNDNRYAGLLEYRAHNDSFALVANARVVPLTAPTFAEAFTEARAYLSGYLAAKEESHRVTA